MQRPLVHELCLLPLLFKTISFHHRSNYQIRVVSSLSPHRCCVIRPRFATLRHRIDERTGNISGIGGAVKEDTLVSDQFQIDYNQQTVKFSAGLYLQVHSGDQHPLLLTIELLRIETEQIRNGLVEMIANPTPEIVSSTIVYLSLRSGWVGGEELPYHYRRLIFPTSEYISSLDVALISSRIGQHIDLTNLRWFEGQLQMNSPGDCCCCLVREPAPDPEAFLRLLYRTAVIDKLRNYQQMATVLKAKINDYRTRFKHLRHSMGLTHGFERRWVRPEIADLSYVAIEGEQPDGELMRSCMPMYNDDSRDLPWTLCVHYNCEIEELPQFMAQESLLIEANTRALFQRCIQIVAVMAEAEGVRLVGHEMNRIRAFLQVGRGVTESLPEDPLPDSIFRTYQQSVRKKLKELYNHTKQEEKQPLLIVSSEGLEATGKLMDVSRSATILVHGFRGSEFDLSKLKSYLSLFLGFSHFYAVKSLMTGDGTNANLSKLGELAGQQVGEFLDRHSNIRYVNVVGFSLGGVIARAMMRHLLRHRQKFNLLLTLSSPHLGMREIESCLVRAGLFYMRRVAKVESIQDLNNERTADRSRILDDLANCNYLNYFKWVILVGSHEDEYVPAYSALCSYRGDNQLIQGLCQAFNQQRSPTVIRCTVRIEVEESLMDKLTRRRVHISLLENDSFLKMLVLRFAHYFTHIR